MKRALFLSLPLTVGLIAIVAVVAAALAFPTAAKDELDAYLDHLASSSPPGAARAEVITLDRARRPWSLSSEQNYPVFGTSPTYQSDRRSDWPTAALQTPIWSDEIVTTSGASHPVLPFPPEEVWCVLLAGESQDQVIFLARHHREPYYTDWVIHQGPHTPFPDSLHDILSAVGCDLGGAH